MTACVDSALCIRAINYSETSRIVTFFGAEHGKIPAIAKGARRLKSRFHSGIELLSEGEIVFHPARQSESLSTLSEYRLTRSFSGLRQRLTAIHSAEWAALLVDALTEPFDPHPGLYEAMVELLAELDGGQRPEWSLVVFESRLLRSVGYGMTIQQCRNCRARLAGDPVVWFSARESACYCRDCEMTVADKRRLSSEVVSVLMAPRQAGQADRRSVLEAHDCLCYYFRELMGKQPSIMPFLRRLLERDVLNSS